MSTSLPAATVVQLVNWSSDNVDHARRVVSSVYADSGIEPLDSELMMGSQGVLLDGLLALDCFSPTGVILRTGEAYDGFVFHHVVSGSAEVHQRNGYKIHSSSSTASISDGSHTTLSRYSPDLRLTCLCVSNGLVEKEIRSVIGSGKLNRTAFTPETHAGSPAIVSLRHLSQALIGGTQVGSGLPLAPLALHSLQQAVTRVLVHGVPNSHTETMARASETVLVPRQLKRAIEFIEAHASLPLTIADIAEAACTTSRTLQMAFKKFKRTTPTAYLRSVRLERVKQDLMNPDSDQSIAQIANKWGFPHLGLFAMQYRDRFGELPRETMRRHRV